MKVGAKVTGLTALLEKERAFGSKVEGPLSSALLKVGEAVARDTRAKYAEYSTRGAEGVRTKVFVSGLWVVQTMLKSRNILARRQDFGGLMMRKAFLPSVHENEAYLAEAAESAVEEAKALYWND